MPRCFLAKKTHHSNNHIVTSWLSDDRESSAPNNLLPSRSLVGSISAAKAVQSIQEPLRFLPQEPVPLIKCQQQLEAVKEEPQQRPSSDEDTSGYNAPFVLYQPPPLPPPPTAVRIRTKEETDAAHDLLELSRSLPPLQPPPPPAAVSTTHLEPHQPPTPPSPPEESAPQQLQHFTTTLVYINEYPLTPPTETSSDSSSSVDLSSPAPSVERNLSSPSPTITTTLAIADGRTKKSRDGVAHKDRSKYVCSECGKNYATSSNLSRHKQTHRSLDSNNAKKCHICGKMYVSMPALSMHILTHNLNHKCNVCGKAFSRPWLLQGHLRSHTGQKPYSCTVCRKSFADRSNLRAHMQTHSPSKNFQCTRCHKTFALKSYLNKHFESACVRSPTRDR